MLVDQSSVVILELNDGYRNVENGPKAKRDGYRTRTRSHFVIAKGCLNSPHTGMPAMTFCKENTGQARDQPVAAGMVDEVALEVIDARSARSSRVTLLLSLLAIGTRSDEPH